MPRFRAPRLRARRNRDDKSGATTGLGFRLDAAAVQLHRLPGDIEPKPEPPAGLALRRRLKEWLEDVLAILLRDPHAVVANHQTSESRRWLGQLHIDGLPAWAVLDRVVQQVGHHLLEPQRVDVRQELVWRMDGNRMTVGCRPHAVGDLAHQVDQIHGLALERQPARLDPGNV